MPKVRTAEEKANHRNVIKDAKKRNKLAFGTLQFNANRDKIISTIIDSKPPKWGSAVLIIESHNVRVKLQDSLKIKVGTVLENKIQFRDAKILYNE